MTRTRSVLTISICIIVCGLCSGTLSATGGEISEAGDIGIDEKLGDFVPPGLAFVDAQGDSVRFEDFLGKPVVMTLVYFHCPTICKPLLSSVSEVVGKTPLTPGVDYNLLTISFDEFDNPRTASPIKKDFVTSLNKKPGADSWRFLTADSATIAGLTDAVGFRFARREKDFAHGASLIVLSPNGKIVRYLYGLRFMPFDLRMAVSEANKGNVAPSIARVLRYCFSYDPEGRRYVFNVTRVAGTGILLLAFGWVFYISTLGKVRKGKQKA